MNAITYDPLHKHLWRDIGGPVGLLLDGAFCLVIILAALGMMIFGLLILFADYVVSPAWALLCKLRPSRPTRALRNSAI